MMGDKMINLFGTMVVFIVILALLFGGLCSITGEEKKGGTIIGNCITAIILYAVILELFNAETLAGGVFESGLPLVNNVEKAGSVRQYFVSSPALFALDFVELVRFFMTLRRYILFGCEF